MKVSPLNPNVPFAGNDLESYRQIALQMPSKGSTNISIAKEIPDALLTSGWPSYRFIVESIVWGTRSKQAVTFLNFSPTEQILLVTTAEAGQFEAAMLKSSQIINSFHQLPPDEDLAAPLFP